MTAFETATFRFERMEVVSVIGAVFFLCGLVLHRTSGLAAVGNVLHAA